MSLYIYDMCHMNECSKIWSNILKEKKSFMISKG